ncbi:MAG TPA: c-type cytochrome, partial [Steroidobacteraceae bacterium]|nr:c-type cytochrome [Steroidobacteraceae bacterium]
MKFAAALLCTGLCLATVSFAQEPATATTGASAGSAEAGAGKAAVCVACHGVNGNSVNPEWPNLAGQNAAYIREQLAMFKSRQRNNPVMQPIVDSMSEQ